MKEMNDILGKYEDDDDDTSSLKNDKKENWQDFFKKDPERKARMLVYLYIVAMFMFVFGFGIFLYDLLF